MLAKAFCTLKLFLWTCIEHVSICAEKFDY